MRRLGLIAAAGLAAGLAPAAFGQAATTTNPTTNPAEEPARDAPAVTVPEIQTIFPQRPAPPASPRHGGPSK